MVELTKGRYLGGLCGRGHDWNGTGMSVRFVNNQTCVECGRIASKHYRKTSVKNKERRKQYRQRPEIKARTRELINRPGVREKRLESMRQYQEVNRDELRVKGRERYHTPEGKKVAKERYVKNRDKLIAYNAEYARTHKDEIQQRSRKYNQRPEIRERVNERARMRRETDPKARLNGRIVNAVKKSLRGNKRGWHWEELVGYTLDELKTHLQSQFRDGMTWNNMGEWHIDHIFPISAFRFTKPEDPEFRQCWALDNLRPLWAEDNLRKSDGWIDD